MLNLFAICAFPVRIALHEPTQDRVLFFALVELCLRLFTESAFGGEGVIEFCVRGGGKHPMSFSFVAHPFLLVRGCFTSSVVALVRWGERLYLLHIPCKLPLDFEPSLADAIGKAPSSYDRC